MSEKILVFKKKRRKQYKKSFGSKVPLTSVRITNIVYNLSKDILEKAVPLQWCINFWIDIQILLKLNIKVHPILRSFI